MGNEELAKIFGAMNKKPKSRPKASKKKTPREVVLEWLGLLTPRDAKDSFCWEDYLQDFFTDQAKAPDWALDHKIRFAVTLRSRTEKYIVVIKEARDAEDIKVFIISVSIPRSDEEIKARTKVQKMYGPASNTVPTRPVDPLQTIWVECFDIQELPEVLNRTGAAILRWELRAREMKIPGVRVEAKVETPQRHMAADYTLDPDTHGSVLSHQAQAALMTSMPGDFPERGDSQLRTSSHDDAHHDDASSKLPE
ncbi:hypothetical protein KQH82_09510 [bacterium]|nr:hypothetical protein [bacterium]